MKIIFLDIDGVLNSREYDARCALSGADLLTPDPRAVVRLFGIIQDTDAKIVLTSSWRLDKTLTWPFPVYDVTPRVDGTRADEINAWLDARTKLAPLHDEAIDAYAILDDEPDAGIGFPPEVFILTDGKVGLSPDDAARIVGLFTV